MLRPGNQLMKKNYDVVLSLCMYYLWAGYMYVCGNMKIIARREREREREKQREREREGRSLVTLYALLKLHRAILYALSNKYVRKREMRVCVCVCVCVCL